MVPGAVNGREGFGVLARSMTIIVIEILASHGRGFASVSLARAQVSAGAKAFRSGRRRRFS